MVFDSAVSENATSGVGQTKLRQSCSAACIGGSKAVSGLAEAETPLREVDSVNRRTWWMAGWLAVFLTSN